MARAIYPPQAAKEILGQMKSKQALRSPKVIFTSTVNTPKENTQVQQFCRERGSEIFADPILPCFFSAVDQLWSYPQGSLQHP